MAIILLLLTGCQNNKTSSFSFRKGITWKSSRTEVRELEKENETDYRLGDPDLSYEDIAVSNYTADSLIYYFDSPTQTLKAVRYFFRSNFTDEDIDNIEKSIATKYGKAKSNDIQMCIKLMEPAGLDSSTLWNEDWYSDYKNWQLKDGTFIATWHDRRGYQILYLNGKLLSEWISEPNIDGL